MIGFNDLRSTRWIGALSTATLQHIEPANFAVVGFTLVILVAARVLALSDVTKTIHIVGIALLADQIVAALAVPLTFQATINAWYANARR